MKTIAIYGGSFNPIHYGHTNVAQYLINEKIADEVHIMVAPSNPFKTSGSIDAFHRYNMCKLACEDLDKRIIVDNYQMVHFGHLQNCYSVDLFKRLIYEHSDTYNKEFRYSFVIGMDVFMKLFDFYCSEWFRWSELVDFIVMARPGYDNDKEINKWIHYVKESSPKLHFRIITEYSQYKTSSTDIRERISFVYRNENWDTWLYEKDNGKEYLNTVINSKIDPKVSKYIFENRLYLTTLY